MVAAGVQEQQLLQRVMNYQHTVRVPAGVSALAPLLKSVLNYSISMSDPALADICHPGKHFDKAILAHRTYVHLPILQ